MDMFPRIATKNEAYSCGAYAIFLPDEDFDGIAWVEKFFYFSNLIIRQLSHWAFLATSVTSTPNGIVYILLLRTRVEMFWVAASRRVALMATDKTFWYRAVFDFIRDTMRKNNSTPIPCASVPVPISVSVPHPAIIFSGDRDLLPEYFFSSLVGYWWSGLAVPAHKSHGFTDNPALRFAVYFGDRCEATTSTLAFAFGKGADFTLR